MTPAVRVAVSLLILFGVAIIFLINDPVTQVVYGLSLIWATAAAN